MDNHGSPATPAVAIAALAIVVVGAGAIVIFVGSSLGPLYIVVALAWFAMAGLGAYIAAQKRRPIEEGVILGLLFGPLGVLVEGLLPTFERIDAPKRPPGAQN
jgi:hypothetical protein